MTAFHVELPSHGKRDVEYLLRNTGKVARTARIYAAPASRDASGAFTLDAGGTSPYVRLPAYDVTLAPGGRRSGTFRVQLYRGDLPKQERYAAVVLEVRQGSIVRRVATIVYLKPVKTLYLPRTLVLTAVGLLVALLLGLFVTYRRRRDGETAPQFA